MIGTNAPSLPPVELSDSAMRLASTLLQIAVDPNATSARLTELNTATQGLRDAITQHDAAKTQAETAAAGLADLQQREQNLAEAQGGVGNEGNATFGREPRRRRNHAVVKAKEEASDKRSAELCRKFGPRASV